MGSRLWTMPKALDDLGMWTTSEVARFLGIHPERVRQHRNAGDIEPVGRLGRTDLYRIEDAEALLELRAELGMRVPEPVSAGGIVDADASWPPLVVVGP